MIAKPRPPEILELDANLVAEIQQRITARQLSEQDYEVFAATLATPWYLANRLTQKNISIRRLQKLVFGANTEKTESVIGRAAEAATSPPAGAGGPSAASPAGPAPDAPPQRRPGHGRNGADDYPGAEKIPLPHESLQPGDSCPECGQGQLSEQARPAVMIRFTGPAPVHAKIYQRQRLRCNLCGKVFTAQAPEGVGADKYDVTVASTIGLLKYGTGMPFYRLAGLQASVGIPLPASTPWKIVSDPVPGLCPAFRELLRQAAQGDVFYHDDTNNRILELMGKRLAKTQAEKASQAVEGGTPEDDSERRGIFTSGIVSTCAGHSSAAAANMRADQVAPFRTFMPTNNNGGNSQSTACLIVS